MDLLRLVNILIDKIKRDYKDDVSIVHVHGSYAYDDTHDRSDLDIYFVPKTPRGFDLCCTFILNEIGCDFWALSWERLEQIASHGERIASIVTDGQVLYYGSDDDLVRFEQLKARALDTSDRKDWLHRAKTALDSAYKDGFIIQNSYKLSDVRTHSISLIYNLSFILAQLNQTTVKRGRKLLKQEILAMPLVPDNFASLYDSIFLSGDTQVIKTACTDLLKNTARLVSATLNAIGEPKPFRDVFGGWYEEMIQSYNKIYHACDTGDAYTALFACVEFTHELNDLLGQTGISKELPDMLSAYDSSDLAALTAAAQTHQEAFEALLGEHGITPLRFSTFEEVERFIDSK